MVNEQRPDGPVSLSKQDTTDTTTVLGHPPVDLAVLLGGLPLLGAGLGLLLPLVAELLLALPVLPMEKLVEFAASADEVWQFLALAGGGLLLGAVCGVIGLSESVRITLTGSLLSAGSGEEEQSFAREDVSAVFLDGKQLVLLGRDSRQLVRAPHAAPAKKLAAAFRAHGYPWHEADPYADRFQRWILHSPATGPELNALLAARKEALKRKAKDDVRDLTQAAEHLGYVLRDKGTDQYWRPLER